MHRLSRNGFSLVELSIVLVILGLLTGGILSGQSLIRAAEIRSVTAELQIYKTAAQTFRDRYRALPGDFRDATKFWGRLSSAGALSCNTNSAAAVATPGACDGDGNGNVIAGPVAASGERFQFWRHLNLAGLIEGSYTGLAGTNNMTHTIGGENAPKSKMSNGVWFTNNWSTPCTHCYSGIDYGNSYHIGGSDAGNWPMAPLFKPEEAWNIDMKVDDGRPAYGAVIALYFNNSCGDGTTATDLNVNYKLSNTSLACTLAFVRSY